MHPAAGPIAHGLIGHDLRVIDLDESYLALLGIARDAAIGRPAVAFLHPDDRATGEILLRRVRQDGRTLSSVQRHVRMDGQAVWANVYVSRIGGDTRQQFIVTCRPLPGADGTTSAVEAHWQMARLLLQALYSGKRAFGDSLIGNPATEILLLSYITEAEAQTLVAHDLAARINVSWPLTRRWLQALVASGFVEAELPGAIRPDTPIRLSPRALAMIEAIFGALVAVTQGSSVAA